MNHVEAREVKPQCVCLMKPEGIARLWLDVDTHYLKTGAMVTDARAAGTTKQIEQFWFSHSVICSSGILCLRTPRTASHPCHRSASSQRSILQSRARNPRAHNRTARRKLRMSDGQTLRSIHILSFSPPVRGVLCPRPCYSSRFSLTLRSATRDDFLHIR